MLFLLNIVILIELSYLLMAFCLSRDQEQHRYFKGFRIFEVLQGTLPPRACLALLARFVLAFAHLKNAKNIAYFAG